MAFELTIVTPEGKAFQGQVVSVVLTGTEGEFGVLPGHEPFLTGLTVGPATLETGKETLHAALTAGFAEVGHDHVTVMVGACEFAHEIDLERAEVAAARAKRQLEEMRASAEGEEVYQEYQESYSRALTRVSVSERFKN